MKAQTTAVSIVICVYNEEKTIENVVSDCCKYNPQAEVIVIDDGSTDNTAQILQDLSVSYPFYIESLEENCGKSWAMVRGVEISKNDIICFIDADLTNLKKEHFKKLITPIQDGTADMVLGQPSETLIDYRFNPFKSLTGQRAIKKDDILPILEEIREVGFGVETYINLYYQSKGKRIKYTILEDLIHPTKFEKTSKKNAAIEFIEEGKEIGKIYLDHHNLIIDRIKLNVEESNRSAKEKLRKLQTEFNNKIKEIKTQILS